MTAKDITSHFNITKIVLHVIKYIIILITMGIIGITLLTISYSLPVNEELMQSSLSHLSQMGWAPLANNRYTQYESFFVSFEPATLDDSTDTIILNNALNNEIDSALHSAISMRNYGRYWHGYVAVLRPILYFIDYWDLLLANSYLQLLLIGLGGYFIFKTTGKGRYFFAYLCSCIFLTPLATGLSLQYSPIFYISLLGTIFCTTKTNWILEKSRRYYIFLFLGIVTCFFDFLTYPLLSFAFPLCWLIVVAGDRLSWKNHFYLLFGGGFSFVFGYGGFFVIKWLIQVIILRDGIFTSGISKVLYYIGNATEDYSLLHQYHNRFDVFYNNFRHYLTPFFIILLCVWITWFFYLYLRGRIRVSSQALVFPAITLTSFAWYLIVNTHTLYHHLFTYRIYGAALLGFMLFICTSMADAKDTSYTISSHGKRLAIVALCLVVGLGASRLAKEDITSINGGEYTELLLTENDELSFEFTPSINHIRSLSFCYHTTDSFDGNLLIELLDNTTKVTEYTISVDTFKDVVSLSQPINWMLKAGHTYNLRLTLHDNDSGIYVLVTPEGTKPQIEYGRAFFNDDQLGNIAPLSFITYRGNVQTIFIKLFLSLCAGTYVLMWILTFSYLFTIRQKKY